MPRQALSTAEVRDVQVIPSVVKFPETSRSVAFKVPPATVNVLLAWVKVTSPLLKLMTAPDPKKRSDQPTVALPRASVLSVSLMREVLMATEARLERAALA